ncbi:hypothetical protein [Burkholderia vietnamiensis]|uniref:hypothetical protein n=1 Tax=Burkholderia vietnamiensis TaxID=60552 RepID=UPI000D786199|nr:hypothetical protein [Burkholderia vietnamiensis]MCA8183945.1 hypothetical protein [Burkholderia vietnamiensis]GBH27933.1 hypothetical protein BvRS1_49820 [Burkholderia vietnamiensis]HDR9009664.1 hypothetical protein [Burkholderia vietnamiensis]HDR9015643.1 hypothetical protein [Burkholderia vietnamiensis]
MALGRKTGGRTKGTPNRATGELKALASQYGPEAIAALVTLMRHTDNDTTRLAAARELLDRGYGRPAQYNELSGPDGAALFPENPINVRALSDEELTQIIRQGQAERTAAG